MPKFRISRNTTWDLKLRSLQVTNLSMSVMLWGQKIKIKVKKKTQLPLQSRAHDIGSWRHCERKHKTEILKKKTTKNKTGKGK